MSSVIFLVEKRKKNGDKKQTDAPFEPEPSAAAAEPQTHAVRHIPSGLRLKRGTEKDLLRASRDMLAVWISRETERRELGGSRP